MGRIHGWRLTPLGVSGRRVLGDDHDRHARHSAAQRVGIVAHDRGRSSWMASVPSTESDRWSRTVRSGSSLTAMILVQRDRYEIDQDAGTR